MKNWKTTLCGIAVIVGAVADATVTVLDPGGPRRPLSVPELIALIATGIGLIAARDTISTKNDRKNGDDS